MPDNQFGRDASNRLTFEMFRVPSNDYPAVCAELVAAFSFEPETQLVVGLDQMFWDFRRARQVVELAWDNWSGFIVTAKNPEAEQLVREMSAYLGSSKWAGIRQQASKPTDGTSS